MTTVLPTPPIRLIEPQTIGESRPVRAIQIPDQGPSFRDTVASAIADLQATKAASDESVRSVLMGQTDNIPSALISMEEASLKFQLMVEVRNRLVDTYQEISRMQL